MRQVTCHPIHISAVERAGLSGLAEGQKKISYVVQIDRKRGKSSAESLSVRPREAIEAHPSWRPMKIHRVSYAGGFLVLGGAQRVTNPRQTFDSAKRLKSGYRLSHRRYARQPNPGRPG
jgi:hypothetical protein